ncbi:beta-1,3-glucan-binding protein-like [Venturia canescens]|uniref:beta-1,3-glucan-binding protein-like n=1 Tax=Venturia canescens TaxID=32260 RepID=UPI001C9C3661|nr:beta-1,3-glucan-binding protein-like [Venturia canescens]
MFGPSISTTVIFFSTAISVFSYEIPTPKFERLRLGGIRVSIRDEPGVQFFALHANVNKPIEIGDAGAIVGEVINPRNNWWSFDDNNVALRKGDILHYWIYVQVNGSSHKRLDLETLDGDASAGGTTNCEKSVTSVRGKTESCRDHLIFEENFDVDIDSDGYPPKGKSSFSREIIIPLDPDYEFCIYRELPNSLKFENGTMSIGPLILDEVYGYNTTFYGRLDLSESCTGSVPLECNRRAIGSSILPPIISARLTTKKSFHFRYGKIEIRAKFPAGDWLYPELWLQPKQQIHGTGYLSGRVILGLVRGNEYLTKISESENTQYGSTSLEFGLRVGPSENVREQKVMKKRSSGTWNEDFHVYTTTWNDEGFRFEVDGEEIGRIEPGQWSKSNHYEGRSEPTNNSMTPFDNEFYITVGLGIGGIRVFPDEIVSGRNVKPWRNIEAKAMLNFWRAKDTWMPSWGMRNEVRDSHFKLDYIRVWTV